MKKFILIAGLLLFASSGWAEDQSDKLYLNCKNTLHYHYGIDRVYERDTGEGIKTEFPLSDDRFSSLSILELNS